MHISDMPEFQNRTQVLSCKPDDSVYDAVVAMTYRRCGAIAVTEDENLIGIFTERDLLARVVAQGRDVEKTKISEVMSTNIETAMSTDSLLLSMGRMNHGGFRHMPVASNEGKLIGMLSQRDFIAYTMACLSGKIDK